MKKEKSPVQPSTMPNDPEDDELLAPPAAAKFLGGKITPLSVGTLAVWRCTKRYDLPFLKIGRSVRYRKSDLRKFRDERRQKPK
jgi:hypothetical protein